MEKTRYSIQSNSNLQNRSTINNRTSMYIDNPIHKRTLIVEYNGENFTHDISDVCQIRSLKKMIQVSMKIRRSLINFYTIDGEELKECDDARLMEIFPGEKVFHLKMSLSPKETEINSSRRKVYLNNYCEKHEIKYLNLYCYTCQKSICLECLEENLHKGHKYMEKYDYLQNSKFLVDKSFKNLTNTIHSMKYSLTEKCEILVKQNEDYFDSIINMIKSLKYKIKTFILNYDEQSNHSLNNLKYNLETIKDTCTDSLEDLKEKLVMENIICCEETFLEFDEKLKSIKEEEKIILNDKKNYEDLINYFETIGTSFNKLYDDFSKYVFKKDSEYSNIFDSKKFQDKIVNEVTELQISKIQNKILENVKEGYFQHSQKRKSMKSNNKSDSSYVSKPNITDFKNSLFEETNPRDNRKNTNVGLDKNYVQINNNLIENSSECINGHNNINRDSLNNLTKNNEKAFADVEKNQFQIKNDFHFPNVNYNSTQINNSQKDRNIGNSNDSDKVNYNIEEGKKMNLIENFFQNPNAISPIIDKHNKNPNTISNICNNEFLNKTAFENINNNNSYLKKDEDNCWKMTYNTGNKTINSSYDGNYINLQDNVNINIPGKLNFDTNVMNPAFQPTENYNHSPDFNKNLPNNQIIQNSNTDNNDNDIEKRIKYPSLNTDRNKNQIINSEVVNKVEENDFIKQIPYKIQTEYNSEKLNDNYPKVDSMDIITNPNVDNNLISNEETKIDNKTNEEYNLKEMSAKTFCEGIYKIVNDLKFEKSKNNSIKESCDEKLINNQINPDPIKTTLGCKSSHDLFTLNKKYFIIVEPIPCTNKIKIYHEHLIPNKEEISSLQNRITTKNKDYNFSTSEENQFNVIHEICELGVDFPTYNNGGKKLSKNLKNNNNNPSLNNSNKERNYFFINSANLNKVTENDLFRKLQLYVSGGVDPNSDSESSRFMYLEFNEKKLYALPDMLEARSSHSILEYNKFIYVVGGKEKNTCEKFDMDKKEWIKMPNLKSGERRNASLCVHKDALYAFCGLNKNSCIDDIEKLNLKNPRAQWEIYPVKRPDNLDLKYYGFAIYPNDTTSDYIYLLGGRNAKEIFDSIVIFDFKENKFIEDSENKLKTKSYFTQSQLVKLGQDYYGLFNSDKLDDILRLSSK